MITPGLMERSRHLPEQTQQQMGEPGSLTASGTAGKQHISLPPVLLLPPILLTFFPSKHKALLFGARHLHARRQLALQQLAGDGLLLIKLQETARQLEWGFPSFQR